MRWVDIELKNSETLGAGMMVEDFGGREAAKVWCL